MSGRSYVTTFKTKAETKGISEMQKHLKDLQLSLKDNKKEQKELSKEIRDANAEMRAINKEIKETGKTTEEQEQRLRKLQAVVENDTAALEKLKLQQAQLKSQIDDTNKNIDDERKALDKLKTSLSDAKKYSAELVKEFGALGAAATAAVAGLFAFTKDSAQWADNLNTLSKQTGISTDELQKFAYASELIDVSTDTLTGSLTKLTRNMQAASQSGTSTAARAFQELGVSITDASGQLRDRQDVFYEVIDALGRIENVTERDALAMNIFGRSAQELNPLILGGAETLKQLGDEAERAGLILDQKTLNGLNEFNDKIDLLKAKGTQIKNLAASEMTPALDGLVEVGNELLDEIKEMAKSGELKRVAKEAGKLIKDGAAALKNIISFVWKYKEAIGAAITAMVTFKISMTIANLVQSLSNAFKVLTGATNAATLAQQGLNTALAANPIGAVISLVAALTAGMMSLSAMTRSNANDIKELDETVQKYGDTLKSLDENEKSYIADAEGEAEKIRVLRDEYNELRQKTDLTAGQKERLKAISESIAGALGLEVSELRSVTGEYKNLNKEIDTYIDNLLRKAKQEAAEETIKTAAKTMYEIESDLETVNQQYDEAHKKLRQAKDDLINFKDEWHSTHNGEMGAKESSIMWEMEQEIKRLQEEYDNLGQKQYGLTQKYDQAKQKIDAATNSLRQNEDAAEGTANEVDDLTEKLKKATETVESCAKALDDYKSKSKSLQSELSILANSLSQVEQGQTLNLDTLLDLIDKYPEYADMLMNAADNAELQSRALEVLFEAKKQEYIMTLKSTAETIEADNKATETLVNNAYKKIKAIRNVSEALGGNILISKVLSNLSFDLSQELRELTGHQGDNEEYLNAINQKMALVENLSFNDFVKSTGAKTSSDISSAGSSSGSSGSAGAEKWSMDSHGVYASGDSYIHAFTSWIARMKNLGQMTNEWEIRLLEELLRYEGITADERYEVEYQLYQAREKLAKEQEDKQKARESDLLDRQKLALAAFNKLVNDKIDAYNAESDAAQKAADAEIKAIDDVEKRKKQEDEDEKRRRELAAINAKLKYDHNLTETERYDLQRSRQSLLNEQYEANRERSIEARKEAIRNRADSVQEKNRLAVEGLTASKTQMSDRMAAVWGTQTYDQRVSNNSKTVNVNLINNGLTEDQAAGRIVQKVLKELG